MDQEVDPGEGHPIAPDDPDCDGLEPEVVRWIAAYAQSSYEVEAIAKILEEVNRLLRRYRASEPRAFRGPHTVEHGAHLRALVEQMPAIVWSTDAALNVTSLAGGGLAGVGGRPRSSMSTPLTDLLRTAGVREPALAAHARALQGEFAIYEYDYRDRTYSAHVGPLRGPTGAIEGTIGAAVDITERRRAEAALLQVLRALADAQRLAQLGSWEWRRGDAAATWSPELYRMWGQDPQAFVPDVANIRSRVHPEDHAAFHAVREAAILTGQASEGAFRILRPDGEVRHLSVLITATLDADGEPSRVHGVCQDITGRMLADRERAELRERQARLDGMLFAARELASRITRNLADSPVSDGVERPGPAAPSSLGEAAAALSRALDDIDGLHGPPSG
jgi:PAS domain S-box-containing protein